MTVRQKLARAVVVTVCAAVLIAIVAQVVSQWDDSTAGWRAAKVVILLAWLWACWRTLKRTVTK